MTSIEKAKMLRGELYDASDPQLLQERIHVRALVQQYNATPVFTPESTKLLGQIVGAMGDECVVETPFKCDYGYNIRMGARCFMNFNCVLLDVCEIRLGDCVWMGPNVQLYTAAHPLDPDERIKGPEFGKPIVIEDNVWIGGSAVVLPGVRIGRGSVIGAGSVVTKDVPPNCVYAGNPAKFIKPCKPLEN